MKLIGVVLISIGLALLAFIAYLYFKDFGQIVSPLPENNGVKVIFVTPQAE